MKIEKRGAVFYDILDLTGEEFEVIRDTLEMFANGPARGVLDKINQADNDREIRDRSIGP